MPHQIETRSGIMFDLENPTPNMVALCDIAHALAHTCRYSGHTRHHFSVAEHSALLADYTRRVLKRSPQDQMRALMHDSAEAYLGDIPGPMKRIPAVAAVWDSMESKVEAAIEAALGVGVSKVGHAWLDEIDMRIVVDERVALMSDSGNDWAVDGLQPLHVVPAGSDPAEAKRMFKNWFRRLKDEIQEEDSRG